MTSVTIQGEQNIITLTLVGPAVSLAGVVGVRGRSGSAATGGRGGAILLVNGQQPSTTARLRRVASARCRASRVGRLFNTATADRVGAVALVTGFHTSELVSLSIARVDATVGGEGSGRGRGAAEGSCPRIRVAAGGRPASGRSVSGGRGSSAATGGGLLVSTQAPSTTAGLG